MVKNVILAVGLLVAGIWLTLYGVEHPILSLRASGWPTTDGLVVNSDVETFRSRRNVAYSAKVNYSYKVGAATYTSDVVEFSIEGGGDQLTARQLTRQFPAGSKVTVHYSPSDPKTACLVPGALSWRDALPITIGLILTFIGVLAALEVVRAKRGKPGDPKRPLKKR